MASTRFDDFTQDHWNLAVCFMAIVCAVCAFIVLAASINRARTNTANLDQLPFDPVNPAFQAMTVTGTAKLTTASITTATIQKLTLPDGRVVHGARVRFAP